MLFKFGANLARFYELKFVPYHRRLPLLSTRLDLCRSAIRRPGLTTIVFFSRFLERLTTDCLCRHLFVCVFRWWHLLKYESETALWPTCAVVSTFLNPRNTLRRTRLFWACGASTNCRSPRDDTFSGELWSWRCLITGVAKPAPRRHHTHPSSQNQAISLMTRVRRVASE